MDTAQLLKSWIASSKRFGSLADFHRVCAICKHCQWSKKEADSAMKAEPKLRLHLAAKHPHRSSAVDVRLRDGTIVENLAVDETGLILGKVVGGQDGIDPRPLPFRQEEIEAYRRLGGFFATRFGLTKWQLQ